MAKKVKTWLTDDIESAQGKDVEADQTVPFSLDGVSYEIDLSAKNAIKLRNDIEVWARHGRRIGGRQRSMSSMSSSKVPAGDGMDTEQRKACREWLRNNTEEYKHLGNRGRIPEHGLALFNAKAGV